MNAIQIFDKPMCCSTGICGPQVDPVLPRFAADLDWLRSQGLSVERFNLAQQPDAFVKSAAVHSLLTEKGTDCLPLTFVGGRLVEQGRYPSRENFIEWTGVRTTSSLFPSLSIVSDGDCSQPGCC
jgi:hypothetical protein